MVSGASGRQGLNNGGDIVAPGGRSRFSATVRRGTGQSLDALSKGRHTLGPLLVFGRGRRRGQGGRGRATDGFVLKWSYLFRV